jgi:putative nucleotidyltransferase with HDIG domain
MSETLRLDRHPARPVIEGIWTHSFASSRMAYAMARKARHPRADEVATAALLHDVGKIVFLVAETEGARGLYDSTPFSDDTRLRHEIAEFGVTHARASAMLAESWGLPGKTIATIALHHAPTFTELRALEGPTQDVAIVHAADLLAHLDPRGRIGDDAPPRPRPGWLDALGLGLDESRMTTTLHAPARTGSTRGRSHAA